MCLLEPTVSELKQEAGLANRRIAHDDILEDVLVAVRHLA